MDAIDSSATYNPEDNFYQQKVKLRDALSLDELLSGRGTTFSIDNEESDLSEKFEKIWNEDEQNNIGIDPFVHEGGPFNKLDDQFECITEDELIRKKLLKPGVGPLVPPKAFVIMNYSIYVEDHDEPIDSTWVRNRPQKFTNNYGEVLLAIDIAVLTMKKGEESLFLADYRYCFGEMGVPPRIPKKACLLIRIRLENFINEDLVNSYENLNPDDKKDVPFDKVLTIAGELRAKGNDSFKSKPKMAFNSYLKAIKILEARGAKDDTEENLKNTELSKSLMNIAQTCLELKKTRDARMYADQAVEILQGLNDDHSNYKIAKCHYLKYRSYSKEDKLDEAKKSVNMSIRFDPSNQRIRDALKNLDSEIEKRDQNADDTYRLMGKKMGLRS